MKACSACQRILPDEAGFCPVDGTALAASEDVPIEADPEDERVGSSMCGGRYRIRRKVADGGMGRVYQALDNEEQRSVAIKILHPEVAMEDIAVERFKREFELSARLPHDHIVEVLAFEQTEDESFAIVMEYLEGEELRNCMQREKFVRPERMIRILAQLAIGLREPHELELVHRDIKPDNIFLCGTESGPLVKLLDFGSVRDNSLGAKKLTVIGTTLGSPFYMSPEQAQGLQDLDHRADVWSIAAITYEALTGKVPFYGVNGPQILLAILGKEPVPPSIVSNADGFAGPKIPEAVDDVIADALTKSQTIRIGSVGELADRLGHAYGLTGEHGLWAETSESELAKAVAAAAVAAAGDARTTRRTKAASVHGDDAAASERGPQVARAAGPVSRRAGPPSQRLPGSSADGFHEEDFIMGLPDASAGRRRFFILGGIGLAVVAAVLFAVLR